MHGAEGLALALPTSLLESDPWELEVGGGLEERGRRPGYRRLGPSCVLQVEDEDEDEADGAGGVPPRCARERLQQDRQEGEGGEEQGGGCYGGCSREELVGLLLERDRREAGLLGRIRALEEQLERERRLRGVHEEGQQRQARAAQ